MAGEIMKLEKALDILEVLLEADKDGYGFGSATIQYVDKKNYVVILKTGGFFKQHLQIIMETLVEFPKTTFRFSDDGNKLVIYHKHLSIGRSVFK